MQLPMSVMVGIAIVVIAIVVIIAFFVSTGGGAARQSELQNTFTRNCLSICARADRNTINLATTYPQWQSTCEELYGVEHGAFVQCLEFCACGMVSDDCAFLCGFKGNAISESAWPGFCDRVKTNYVTEAKYGNCDCLC